MSDEQDAKRWRKVLGLLAMYTGENDGTHFWRFRTVSSTHKNLNDAIDAIGDADVPLPPESVVVEGTVTE